MTNHILPIALSDNKPSAVAKEQIKKLMGPHPVQLIFKLITSWAIIIGAIWIAVIMNQVIVSVIAMFIVASRQNILALLMHEQSHCLGFKTKIGDPIVNFFAAYPLMLTVENYSQVHLAHHKYFFTEKDPDIIRKSGKQWTFPMPPMQLTKNFLSDLLAMNVIALFKGKRRGATETFKRPHLLPKWTRKAYYAVFFITITLTHTWDVFLIYWCLPLVTITQVFVRWGALCEHLYTPNATIIESSPIIILSWWEKLLMPNLNFSLHPYHHFYPGIAWCNLPKVHQIYINDGLVDETKLFRGNLSYLKFLLSGAKEAI